MKVRKTVIVLSILSLLLLCTLGIVFDLQDKTANTTGYFAENAQDDNYPYEEECYEWGGI